MIEKTSTAMMVAASSRGFVGSGLSVAQTLIFKSRSRSRSRRLLHPWG